MVRTPRGQVKFRLKLSKVCQGGTASPVGEHAGRVQQDTHSIVGGRGGAAVLDDVACSAVVGAADEHPETLGEGRVRLSPLAAHEVVDPERALRGIENGAAGLEVGRPVEAVGWQIWSARARAKVFREDTYSGAQ